MVASQQAFNGAQVCAKTITIQVTNNSSLDSIRTKEGEGFQLDSLLGGRNSSLEALA